MTSSLATVATANVGAFVANALVTFDHRAHLFVIELKVVNAAQLVTATEVNMTQFIGVHTLLVVLHCVSV